MLIKNAVFNVCDTETTGFDPNADKVVEIASIHTMLGSGFLACRAAFVKPGIPIPEAASNCHHIYDEDVADARPIEDVASEMLGGDVFVAHNLAFDQAFVPGAEFMPGLCTMRLARQLWPTAPSATLQSLREALRLSCPEVEGFAPHRAGADAIVAAYLLQHELVEYLSRQENPEAATVEDLIAFTNRPVLQGTVRFGKHKGQKWAKLLVDLGRACEIYQRTALVDLNCRRIQCDEIWSFCYAKAKNVPEEMQDTEGVGDVWTWTAISPTASAFRR